ncbi:hypothetical protein FV233_28940, partial [Methylobacterium sp. WL7]
GGPAVRPGRERGSATMQDGSGVRDLFGSVAPLSRPLLTQGPPSPAKGGGRAGIRSGVDLLSSRRRSKTRWVSIRARTGEPTRASAGATDP